MTLANAGWFAAGLLLLVLGAEWLVRGGARLAAAAGVSPLVVGLTVVALGTSAPEFAVSLGASLRGQGDIAFGNAVGSNIFNVLFVLGASALLTPLVVARQLVRLDVPLMIVACALVPILGLDGRLGRLDGALLASGLAVYVVWSIRVSRAAPAPSVPSTEPVGRLGVAVSAALVVLGLGLLVLGARWLVGASIAFAQALGVSELVIGLTVVAIGTSLPEAATSLVAAARGQRDIAVGNVVGSNIFNMLGVLGLSAAVSPSGIGVAPEAMRLDVPVMVAAALACLPVFAHGPRIERWQGALFLANYFAYTAYVVLASSRHPARATFGWLMLAVALPISAALLAMLSWRALRARARADL